MTVAPPDAPHSRLPLHLMYRFDQPGVYSMRLTAWKAVPPDPRNREVACQSNWTEFEVKPFSETQRTDWLQAEAAKISAATPGHLVGDIIPSLLAWPDEKALAILLRVVDHRDYLVRQFVRQSLDAFDPIVLRRVILPAWFSELRSGRIRY